MEILLQIAILGENEMQFNLIFNFKERNWNEKNETPNDGFQIGS